MTATSEMRRTALADFLRTRRERITPNDVDLPSGGRRRTPGLRREEVALLAGVGVTWYTWLEQGRPINASVQVLDAIAKALRMDTQERLHLLRLADVMVAAHPTSTAAPSAAVEATVAQLDPFPAFVVSERYDILAYNRAYNALVGNLDAVDPAERNHTWLFFTHPYWRSICVNRTLAARHLVNTLRATMATHLDDPLWTNLIARLREASPEFDELWNRNDVTSPGLPEKNFHSPYGELHITGTRYSIGTCDVSRLMVYAPRDDETHARLERLVREGNPAAETVAVGAVAAL